ncbi:MAG: CHAP domain-containing protein, partial [Oscillospiraceae bacterium]|nr:CHAP domain-containing protein [Oscillospiraceae bacterium]
AQLDSKTANAGSGNYTKYWRDLKPSYQGSFWCYCFVSWCARRAGIPASILPTCYSCGEGVNWYKARGQWVSRTAAAKPGDLVFFADAKGRTAHIGIVYKVDGRIYTYEGNSSSAADVTPNGGAVVAKSYETGYARIVGYARPKYEEDEDMTDEQFDAHMSRYSARQDKLGVSDRLAPDEYAEAVRLGLTDGTRPQGIAIWQRAAVTALRAYKKALADFRAETAR